MYDVLGRLVVKDVIETIPGHNKVKIDVPTMSAGTYFLVLDTKDELFKTIKFTKIND